ncbi:hypothetical protein N7540_008559 [Penicillium herquei]|nr:hypothetical protein N7540_008559 [Penicillium herquei]
MVNPSKIITSLLAFNFASGCLAQHDSESTTKTVNYYSTFVGEIYEYIAGVISKPDQPSCTVTLTHGTRDDNLRFEGYSYEATTKTACDNTAEKKEILKAVEECANHLNIASATSGCCRFNHGRSWTGNLRLSAHPHMYPVSEVRCNNNDI